MKTNQILRDVAKEKKVPFWMVADKLGISEASMTRLLRRELPAAEQERLLRIIEEIAAQRKEG